MQSGRAEHRLTIDDGDISWSSHAASRVLGS